jgi:hypothetical protein
VRLRRLLSPSENLPQIVPRFLRRKRALDPDLTLLQRFLVLVRSVPRVVFFDDFLKNIDLYPSVFLARRKAFFVNGTTSANPRRRPVFAGYRTFVSLQTRYGLAYE